MRFRTLLNELQMLLHEHPVNQAREARGELPVNSLWLWGGGKLPAVPVSHKRVYACDGEARALGAFCGARMHPLPERLEKPTLETEGVILLDALTAAGQRGDAYGWRETLRSLEEDWFVPLLGVLRTISPQGLRLLDPVNGKALHLQRTDAWKIWRPAQSDFNACLSRRLASARKIYSHEIEEKTPKAQAGGSVVGKLNPGADKDFQKALEPVYKKYGGRIPGGQDILEAIQKGK